MTAKNEITGDKIKSKPTSDKFRDNFDKVFGKPEKKAEDENPVPIYDGGSGD